MSDASGQPAEDTSGVDEIAAELATNTIIAPDDLLADLSPFAQLYYAEQAVYAVVQAWTPRLAEDAERPQDTPDGVKVAFQGLLEAAGNLDAALVAVGVLPPEAIAS